MGLFLWNRIDDALCMPCENRSVRSFSLSRAQKQRQQQRRRGAARAWGPVSATPRRPMRLGLNGRGSWRADRRGNQAKLTDRRPSPLTQSERQLPRRGAAYRENDVRILIIISDRARSFWLIICNSWFASAPWIFNGKLKKVITQVGRSRIFLTERSISTARRVRLRKYCKRKKRERLSIT